MTGSRWQGRTTARIKLPADIDLEVAGIYRSGFNTIQGRVNDNVFMNFGARKKILKGKAIVNMSIRDVFASRIRESEAFQPEFYLFNSRFNGRFVTLGLSWGFGKGEAMEFSGGRRRF